MDYIEVLYHGSDQVINDFIEPRKAEDALSSANSQEAVYATDIFNIAKGMSLTEDKWSFADYGAKDFKVVFAEEPPDANKFRYVYELSPTGFQKDPSEPHQYLSKSPAKIIKVHKFTTEELGYLWRMATPEELINNTP